MIIWLCENLMKIYQIINIINLNEEKLYGEKK
jgi:hypothetical protein